MGPISNAPRAIEEFVGAFDALRHRKNDVDLFEFLPPSDHPSYADVVVELIRVDLEHSWRQGSPKSIADYQVAFADVLAAERNLALVAFEEYRLRRIAGEYVSRDEYRRQYEIGTDDWPELPCGAVVDPIALGMQESAWKSTPRAGDASSIGLADTRRDFPEVGTRFLDFELVSELGRGALGRVYLARQGGLARRFVALKITARGCDEAQRLAQLQHTNIVPIYSFHTYQTLQALCMPFLGRRTLADVIHSYRCGQNIPASGQALIGTLGVHFASTLTTDQTPEEQTAAIESQYKMLGRTEGVRRIENMTFIEAATWMTGRIADALAHAHEHGIVHRDLKPANILLSDDGEPLILDFHLSAHQPAEAVMGGTLPYMSVEQLQALTDRGEVGPRSDIYSLGVILFEMLTGTTPYPVRIGTFHEVVHQMLEDRRQPIRSVRQLNPRVSRDLATIVERCLHVDPNQRYQSARQLHEDLVGHLEHRPLRFAPNRSLIERGRKWIRRHPRLFSATSIGAMAVGIIVTLACALSMYSERLASLRAQQSRQELRERLTESRSLMHSFFVNRQVLARSIRQGKETLAKQGLLESSALHSLASYKALDPDELPQVQRDAADLLYLLASGSGHLASATSGSEREKLQAAALRFNALSQALQPRPVPRAVIMQRERLRHPNGVPPSVKKLADAVHVTSDPRDVRLLGYEADQRHDYPTALKLFKRALDAAPQDPTLRLSVGVAYLNMRQYADAEDCFDKAVTQHKDFTLARELRGIARLGLEKYEDARADFDQVLAEDPQSISALINRSVALEKQEKFDAAIEDITAAMHIEGFPTRLYFMRAGLRRRAGDGEGAAEDHRTGLQATPNDDASWIARGVARLSDDLDGALADFEAALALNPSSHAARQNLAHVYGERLNRPADAIKVLTELIELYPEDAQSYVNRGVLHARVGHREEAIADAVTTLKLTQDPLLTYQAACIYALTSREHAADAETAMQLVHRALKTDLTLCRFAKNDPDLNAIRTRSEFQSVLEAALTLHHVP